MTTTYGAVALVLALAVAITVYIAAPQPEPYRVAGPVADGGVRYAELAGRWVRLPSESGEERRPGSDVQIVILNADGTFRCELRSPIETLWAEGTYSLSDDILQFDITASGFPEGAGESVRARFCAVGSYLRLHAEGHGVIQSCDLARIGDASA